MSKYYQLDKIASAIKPQLVNGVWRKPKLSARRVARIRKECLRYGTINGVQAEWNPEWDKPAKSWIPRTPNGHAFDRAQPDRIALIDKNMKAMPKLIQETRKEAFLSKPHTFLDVKLEPEDYEDFYKLGRRVTSKSRKADRVKAAKELADRIAAENAKKAKNAKKGEGKKEEKGKKSEGKKVEKKEEGKKVEKKEDGKKVEKKEDGKKVEKNKKTPESSAEVTEEKK